MQDWKSSYNPLQTLQVYNTIKGKLDMIPRVKLYMNEQLNTSVWKK